MSSGRRSRRNIPADFCQQNACHFLYSRVQQSLNRTTESPKSPLTLCHACKFSRSVSNVGFIGCSVFTYDANVQLHRPVLCYIAIRYGEDVIDSLRNKKLKDKFAQCHGVTREGGVRNIRAGAACGTLYAHLCKCIWVSLISYTNAYSMQLRSNNRTLMDAA